MSANKDWRVDIAPILFFTAVIGVKSYYLLQYIRDTGHFWSLITDGGNARAGDGSQSVQQLVRYSISDRVGSSNNWLHGNHPWS